MFQSIITINYKNAESLYKIMESVFAQTYTNIEHIFVNASSVDGRVNVIHEYEFSLTSLSIKTGVILFGKRECVN